MYKSKEIRWFSSTKQASITDWFSERGQSFSNTKPRTDYYLPNTDHDDISVKLREGNVEIKQRTGKTNLQQFTNHATGYYENWVKWVFNIKEDDILSAAIITKNKYLWTEVYKERIGIKLTTNEIGEIIIKDIRDMTLTFGCQIEYTRLLINKKEWFTFGVEWFGEKNIELDAILFSEILGESNLTAEDSFSYPQFLSAYKY